MRTNSSPPRIALTPGEPAGIGPDLLVQLAQQDHAAQLVAVASAELLRDRARRLQLPLELLPFKTAAQASASRAGQLYLLPHELACLPEPGHGNAANAGYVIATLNTAVDCALRGEIDALVTGPINKHLVNAGLGAGENNVANNLPGGSFSGHTEYLAARSGTGRVVMMLAVEQPRHLDQPLRVALATTHLPLREVADAISYDALVSTVEILQRSLVEQFGIARPRILVCGLNPHAGEQGDLGREEIETIQPAIEHLRARGFDLSDAMPADTAFTPAQLQAADAVLAMYHDQGLPVLKSHGFGDAVNITLGLPFVRTSVDHGTAFDLAGSGRANSRSLQAALRSAIQLCQGKHEH
ncbi:MAG: 4-hydroxythreonine-4-phosphate dehydrogenase PdxA [Pseudomonadales bacterium]|nr:4-hydroxythreonine-4-phosphate dehydrogenase PdxA [Pseudomonadales bacterium]